MRMNSFRTRREWLDWMLRPQGTPDKIEWLQGIARGARVLDLGCLDHGVTGTPRWLHGHLMDAAREIVGVDSLDPARFDSAALRGAHVIQGNVETVQVLERGGTLIDGAEMTFRGTPPVEKFQVVIAGDIIEHLGSPLALLETGRRHLEPGGLMVITTPNPFAAEQAIRVWCGDDVAVNPQHTCWIDPATFWELNRRTTFSILDGAWLETEYHAPTRHPENWPWGDPRSLCDRVMENTPLSRRDWGVILRA